MAQPEAGAGIGAYVDPSNPAQVQMALRRYLHEVGRLANATMSEAPAPLGRGFDTYIYSFRLAGDVGDPAWAAPLVLRLYRRSDDDAKAARESAIQQYAAAHGLRTPAVLAAAPFGEAFGRPFMIMERVPGRPLLDAMTSRPLSARRYLRQMARLHTRLHSLPVEACPLPAGPPLIDRELASLSERTRPPELRELGQGVERLSRLRHLARGEVAVLCHGDFHPLNILVDDHGRLTLLDWSDATLGDRHYDVARTLTLLDFGHVAAETFTERLVLRSVKGLLRRWYLRAYCDAMPVEPRRLLYWEALHTLRALVGLLELDAEPPASLGPPPEALRRLRRGVRDDVRRYFERKMRRLEQEASSAAAGGEGR